MILYLHGFNSSPASFKARLVEEYLRRQGREQDFACPALPHQPRKAIALAERTILSARESSDFPVGLIGSSLGGFYATWLAEKLGLKAALVNPAVRPFELLRDYPGQQANLYTGERYEITPRDIDDLRRLEVPAIDPARFLLLAQTGDEILDYRQAVGKYRGARQIVIEGGDHSFQDFGDHIALILRFLDEAPPKSS